MANEFEKEIINKVGADILNSNGMALEKGFIQHGNVSVYEHSLSVAVMCLRIKKYLPFKVNTRSLVRGALLHDYFLYDWHVADKSHKWHGFRHARSSWKNARRDFALNAVEENMILSHMFPLNLSVPKYRESVILCIADKICALSETVCGVWG